MELAQIGHSKSLCTLLVAGDGGIGRCFSGFRGFRRGSLLRALKEGRSDKLIMSKLKLEPMRMETSTILVGFLEGEHNWKEAYSMVTSFFKVKFRMPSLGWVEARIHLGHSGCNLHLHQCLGKANGTIRASEMQSDSSDGQSALTRPRYNMPSNVQSSWSLHGNKEICARYEILERVGSGTYSDVYRARRKEDGLIVALKEVHDYQSSWREIDALQKLAGCPNIVSLYEWFWREHEDAVLVLEFLPSDLYSVIKTPKKNGEKGMAEAEVKAWMIQLLQAVADCHGNFVVHRDLKPSNLLISADGVLKLADFGQARLLEEPPLICAEEDEHSPEDTVVDGSGQERLLDVYGNVNEVLYGRERSSSNVIETNSSDLAETANLDLSSKNEDVMDESEFTSGVGTRWYRAPELLYGATNYDREIDLWSLGCIFGELLTLEPLFPGTSDIDQLSRLVRVLGNPTEEIWPGCSNLPDYGKICFPGDRPPVGLRNHVPNCSESAFLILERLVCYDPLARLSAVEVIANSYFIEEPLPALTHELKVPPPQKEEDSLSDKWGEWNNTESDSDLEDLNGINVVHSNSGYSIQF
eukprot:Gb_16100 [translate_table: standard]